MTDENFHSMPVDLVRVIGALVGAIVMLLIILTWLVFVKIPSDEHATCTIQARGLPAAHIQATMWRDISVLIQPEPGKKLELEKLPLVKQYAAKNLYKELPRFNGIEKSQPETRHC